MKRSAKTRRRRPVASPNVFPQVVGLVLMAFSLLAWISLLTRSSLDPPTSSLPPEQVQNWIGWLGAYLSHYLSRAMGYAAYAGVFLIFAVGLNRLRRRPVEPMVRRAATLLVCVIVFCATTGLAYEAHPERALKLGGYLGIVISSKLLLPYLGMLGSYVLLVAVLSLWVILATDLPSMLTVERLSALRRRMLTVLLWLREHLRLFRGAWFARLIRVCDPGQGVLPEGAGAGALSHLKPEPADAGSLGFGKPEVQKERPYVLPELSLLQRAPQTPDSGEAPEEGARMLEEALISFDVSAKVVRSYQGPLVTTHEIKLPRGARVNTVLGLSRDLALAMKTPQVRIWSPIPGKANVGIEIARPEPSPVYLGDVLADAAGALRGSPLMVGIGKTTSGEPFCADLVEMPHLLIAGATGSGKSVCIHAMIASILFRNGPRDVRFLMIDPKMLELSAYDGIPHLVGPVITNPARASEGLRWAVAEMERRYQMLAGLKVRNIEAYNRKVERHRRPEKGAEPASRLPFLVVVVDELADLMMTAPDDVDDSLARLAQMARAVGIHLIVATQRPSVDVITGTIKANFPARIALRVASKVDSRVILDTDGAEVLLGRGDMLYAATGREPVRVHGAFISSEETQELVRAIHAQGTGSGDGAECEEE